MKFSIKFNNSLYLIFTIVYTKINKDMTLSKIITKIEQLDAEQLSENYEKFECVFKEFPRMVAAPIDFPLEHISQAYFPLIKLFLE